MLPLVQGADAAAELLIGLCAGAATSAGVFALISVVGIIPRLAGHSHTGRCIHKYEWAVILGGSLTNIWYFFQPSAALLGIFGYLLEGAVGVGIGMFVGSLVMALAEVLQVFPILIRRVRLRAGVMYLGLAMAFGKAVGAVIYFWNQK